MKKVLSVIICIILLTSLGAAQDAQPVKYVSGGIARQLALGGSPYNSYIMDYSNVTVNPAYAVKYTNFLYTEVGHTYAAYNANQQSLGFTLGITNGLAVGLSVGNQEGPIFAANSYGAGAGAAPSGTNFICADNMIAGMNNIAGAGTFNASATWRPFQLYGSFQLGPIIIGAAFYRIGWSATSEQLVGAATDLTTDEVSIGQTGIKVGTLIDFDQLLIDGSVLLRINSATAKTTPPSPGTSSEASATGTEFGINARAFLKLTEKFVVVPIFRLSTFGYQPEIKATPNPVVTKPNDYGRTEFEVGGGANINVGTGRVFAGLSYESIKLTNNVTTTAAAPATGTVTTNNSATINSFPKVNLGVEFDISSYVTARAGYFKAFSSLTQTSEPPSPKKTETQTTTYDFSFCPPFGTNAASQLLSFGLGIHYDRFNIDGYLNEEWLADGPNIVSGVANAMFGVLSLSYNFN